MKLIDNARNAWRMFSVQAMGWPSWFKPLGLSCRLICAIRSTRQPFATSPSAFWLLVCWGAWSSKTR